MDTKKIIETNKERKDEIAQELSVISSVLELEVEEQLAPIKVQALAEGARYTKELLKLDTQIGLMKIQLETRTKIEEKRQEAKDLAFQLLTDEEKQMAYIEMKKRHTTFISDLRKKYGIE